MSCDTLFMKSNLINEGQPVVKSGFGLDSECASEFIEKDCREAEILLVLMEAYIKNTIPISSFYITQDPRIKLSSATVRSVLASLEAKGYLFSPHRSAGRLPTEKAYCFYIKNLLPPSRKYIQEEEERYIQEEYLRYNLALMDILKTTGRLLSILTNYAVLVFGPAPKRSVLKHLEFIDMGAEEVLVIFVTRVGEVLSAKIFVEERIPENYLRSAARQFNQKYKGMDFTDIYSRLQEESHDNDNYYHSILVKALARDFNLLIGEQSFLKEGIAHLHSCVEHQALQRLCELIQNRYLEQLIWAKVYDKEELGVSLASEYDKKLSGISIVSGNYKMGEKNIGLVSVIGPICMDYSRVMTLVEYIRHLISNMVTRLSN